MPQGKYTAADVVAPSSQDVAASSSGDKRNSIQQSFDENTTPNPKEPLLETGLKSVVHAIGSPFVHPVETLKGMAKSIPTSPADAPRVAGEMGSSMAEGAHNDYQEGGLPYAATKMAGDTFGNIALGAAGSAGVDAAASGMKGLYPKSTFTPAEAGARGLTKALTIPEAAQKSFVPAATEEAGSVLDYAKRQGIPINGTADWAKAAKGASQEIQDFFDKDVVGPNAKLPISVAGTNFRGRTFGEGPNSTVESVNQRINEISAELNPNFRKGLASQTSAANVSDADLIAEKQALTGRLHDTLAKATGLQPEDIAALRQRAGKLRTIADESSLADASNLKASGNAQMGKSPLGSGGKIGLLDRGLQAIQGGPEIIGNRALNKALTGITPKNTPFPDINPPGPSMSLRLPPVRGMSSEVPTFDATPNTEQADQLMSNIGSRNALRDAQASANKMAAQNEFLHSNNLEQQAQDAAAQRAQRVSGFKDSRDALATSQRKLEGEAARTIGRDKALKGGK